MVRVGLMALLLLVAGFSAGDGSEPSDEEPPETTGASEELRVMRISSGEPGQGSQRPRAVVAPSASALSEGIGASVPESGSGTYLAAYWGEKPTGGYSMFARSARRGGPGGWGGVQARGGTGALGSIPPAGGGVGPGGNGRGTGARRAPPTPAAT